ncbi:MAG: ribosome recycling factor [Chloroflexota bacterium]|nr:ribosome recycling factor [Chloroflexota bacterium]
MLEDIYKDSRVRMKSAVQALREDLIAIRTGRANPALIEKLSVQYYGASTPLQQLASIGVPEPRTLLIRPFDPATMKEIERAILASDLGLTPNNDGKNIRLHLPTLTEERREDLVRVVGHRLEEARIAIRNVRRDSIKELREFENEDLISEDELNRGEDDIQKIIDTYIEEIDNIGERKVKEIREI